MRSHRGVWAGACLLLALVGCGKNNKTIKDTGVYSPILTGISSNHEPAARGADNLLTAQVTNVNDLTLRYHWKVAAGTLADSTSQSVHWTPPDSIGSYDVTVSIEANDGDKYFFKTMTAHMSVDNEFTRWTNDEAVKFDPAPVTGGGVLFAQYSNVILKTSDAYRVDAPLGPSIQLTTNFWSVASPTPRADKVEFAFAARKNPTDSVSLYLLPFSGGDSSMARLFAFRRASQTRLATPRFSPVGTLLAYETDSLYLGNDFTGNPQIASNGRSAIRIRDGGNPLFAAFTAINDSVFNNDFTTGGSNVFLSDPMWGPDKNQDGQPDSIMMTGVADKGSILALPNGLYVAAVSPPYNGTYNGSAPINAGASSWIQLMPGTAFETPDWSPDGQYIVFVQRNAGTHDRDIWIINRSATDISQAVRVTYGPADDSQPRFSSDGNTIYFISNRVDRYGVTGVYGTERRGTNVWSVAHFDRP